MGVPGDSVEVPGWFREGGVPGGLRVLQTPTLMVHSRFSVKIFLYLALFRSMLAWSV